MSSIEALRNVHSGSDLYRQKAKVPDYREMMNEATVMDFIVNRLTGVDDKFAHGDWRAVAGRTILDIGCGSDWSADGYYPPHLVRLLAANGANAFGIDIVPQSRKFAGEYTHVQADIIPHVMQGTLSDLPQIQGVKFDAINMLSFLGGNPSPALYLKIPVSLETFQSKLMQQLKGMLKENGFILNGPKHYQLRNGRLAQLKQFDRYI